MNMNQQASLLSHIYMTHEANLSNKMIEDEWQLYCEEHAKETHENEEGKNSQGPEEGDVLP